MKLITLFILVSFLGNSQIESSIQAYGGVSNYKASNKVYREGEYYRDFFKLSYGIYFNTSFYFDSSFAIGLGVGMHETNGLGSYRIEMDDNYTGQVNTTNIDGTEYRVVENTERKEYYLELPLYILYRFKKWRYLNGFSLGYQLKESSSRISYNAMSGTYSDGFDLSYLKKWNLSFYMEIERYLSDRWFLGLSLRKGLSNIGAPEEGFEALIQRNQILLGAGYRF